jgi:hypothetical protein
VTQTNIFDIGTGKPWPEGPVVGGRPPYDFTEDIRGHWPSQEEVVGDTISWLHSVVTSSRGVMYGTSIPKKVSEALDHHAIARIGMIFERHRREYLPNMFCAEVRGYLKTLEESTF